MKYVYKIVTVLALFAGLASSCKDDDASIPGGIAVDKEEITVGPEGGTERITVNSYKNWVAGASRPWIAVSPANGSGTAECRLAIDSTLENTARTSQIRFALEGQESKLITVTQFGFGKQIIAKEIPEDNHVDLIMLGATGLNAVERLFIGSVSEYVIRNATCDVLVVRTDLENKLPEKE